VGVHGENTLFRDRRYKLGRIDRRGRTWRSLGDQTRPADFIAAAGDSAGGAPIR
jgi:hypothetical protein